MILKRMSEAFIKTMVGLTFQALAFILPPRKNQAEKWGGSVLIL